MDTLTIVLLGIVYVVGLFLVSFVYGVYGFRKKKKHMSIMGELKCTFWFVFFGLLLIETLVTLPSNIFYWIGYSLSQSVEEKKNKG